MPDLILGKDPFRTPFEQAAKNLQERIPKGLRQDQLDKIQSGGKPITSTHWNWHDTLAHQHADSFVIAKMAQADLLAKVHGSLAQARKEGISFEKWAKNITPELQKAGWWGKKETLNPKTGKMEMSQLGSVRRLRVIYHTNMRVAAMAAHYKSLKAATATHPFWRYVAVQDKKTRPSHGALHNQVFRHDHPFWETHFPPNGWLCRCTVVAESDRSLRRLSDEIQRSNEGKDKADQEPLPEIVQASDVPEVTSEKVPASGPLPRGVKEKTVPVATFRGVRPDPGWSHNPGSMTWSRETMLADKIRLLPKELAKASLDQMASKDYSQWSAFVNSARQQVGQTKGIAHPSGSGKRDLFAIRWMESDLLDALQRALGVPDLEPFLATDIQAAEHPVRQDKNVRPSGSRLMPLDEYLKLPQHLGRATAYLDRDEPGAVAFAAPLGGDLVKTVFRVQEQDGRRTLRLVTSGLVKPNAFADAKRWPQVAKGKR